MSRGTRVADAEGNATSRTRPARSPRISASSPAAASMAVATAFAWRASTRPDWVRRMPRPTRSTSAMPVRSSNRRSCWLTAGWL